MRKVSTKIYNSSTTPESLENKGKFYVVVAYNNLFEGLNNPLKWGFLHRKHREDSKIFEFLSWNAIQSTRKLEYKWRFWKIASAVPWYQFLPVCICAGIGSMNILENPETRHPCRKCFMSECDLNCVSTKILNNPELAKLFSTKSNRIKPIIDEP